MTQFTYNSGLSLKTTQVPQGVGAAESGLGTKQYYFNQPVLAGDFDLGEEIESIDAPCWIAVKASTPFSIKFDANPASVVTMTELQFKLTGGGAPAIVLSFAAGAQLEVLALK